MNLNELFEFAYLKQPLHEIYPDLASVPREFILEWFKDKYDYKRSHSIEELLQFSSLKPEEKLRWLEEAARITWAIKEQEWIRHRKALPL